MSARSAAIAERRAARAVGLRRRRPVRSDREEAVLPRRTRRAGVQLRHARLRPALQLLPELGHVAGAARSATPSRRRATPTPEALVTDALAQGARVVVCTYNEPLITAEWAVAIFKEARARGPRDRLRLERQRHAGGARLPPAVTSISTRSISRASTTATTASSADARSRSSTPSGICTRPASGSRSSRCSSPASTTATTELARTDRVRRQRVSATSPGT